MSTPNKSESHGVPNDTVNTPQPRATSTVQRKSTLKNKFDGKLHSGEEKGRPARQGLSYENEPPQREETLLGLLEYSISDTNKENMSVPNFNFPIKTKLNKEGHMDNSISEVSVAFEPNEITARSSGVSISAKRQFPLNESFHGINLSKRQRLRETAKISDEESLSGSIVDAELTDNELIPIPNDIYENSVIGLTKIINTLQDVVSETRRLVNPFLKAQKKKNPVIQDNARKETYTLPCNKESMMPTTNCNKFDEDINLEKLFTTSNKVMVTTDKLYTCIVGMTREVNVELTNIGDRWITYTFKLIDIGLQDTKNIELNIPTEKMFLEPNRTQSTKIGVKVTKMCNAIRVTLHIFLLDMVSKSTKWSMEHTIIVKPIQLDIDITCQSDKQQLDFQYIAEEAKILPITFYNRNNVDVAVNLSILHDGPELFSIDGSTYLVFKPHEKIVTNIKCEKSRSTSIDLPQRQPKNWNSKLIVHLQCKDTIFLRKEVPLCAQEGTIKIQIRDTGIYIIEPTRQGKSFCIINIGNLATEVSITIMPMEGHVNATEHFYIDPDNMFLQVGEKKMFLIGYILPFPNNADRSADSDRCVKLKIVASNDVHQFIIKTEEFTTKVSILNCKKINSL